MKAEKSVNLSEKQELLLMRAHDGECSFFARWQAQRLLKRNPGAVRFQNSLQALQPLLEDTEEPENTSDGELWNKIERRIADEEHAALFLGERRFDADPESREGGRNWLLVAAPLSAAALALFFYFDGGVNTQAGSGTGAVARSTANTVAALDRQAVPVSVTANSHFSGDSNPWEVEWIRSEGRVRMIQNSRGRVPILWINRSVAANQLDQPQMRGLDNGNEIRMIQERVQSALTVNDE